MHLQWFGRPRRLISPLSFFLGFALRDLMEEDSKVRREIRNVFRRARKLFTRKGGGGEEAPGGPTRAETAPSGESAA